MVPKLFKAGKSFKGLGRYLSTDPKAKTAERVAWTHTLNCAYDDVPSAIDEMLWTYRSADWLKRQAGVPTGGTPLKDPVRHFSLNWHRDDQPNREHMIETVQNFLAFMKWDEHQAVIFCHTDKHPHAHVMVNAVHPENGRALDSRFDRSRAQRWAFEYEKEHGLHCEQRLLPEEEREPAPTRGAWQKMKEAEREFEQTEAALRVRAPDYFERKGEASWKAAEWKALHEFQKSERLAFFEEGKKAYREERDAVFREVRAEFRHEWRAYYEARRDGLKPERLSVMKADILTRQNTELEDRRDEACKGLRKDRDEEYQFLLSFQREERAALKERQESGQRSHRFFDRMYDPNEHTFAGEAEAYRKQFAEEHRHLTDPFEAAANEVTAPNAALNTDGQEREKAEPESEHEAVNENHKVRDPANAIGDLGMGGIGALAAVAERLFDSFLGGSQSRPQPQSKALGPARDASTSDAAFRRNERQLKDEEAQAKEADRLEAYWRDRERRRGRGRD